MGHRLDKVINDDEGRLIGITEHGDVIPLSAPKLGLWFCHYPSNKTQEDFINERLELIKRSDNDSYFMLGEPVLNMGTFLIAYNEYTKRV